MHSYGMGGDNRSSLLVSVIVPTYSSGRLNDLKELLESLRTQTYPHLEIIIVVEGQEELCEEIGQFAATQGMSRVRVLFNDSHQGAAAARNAGVAHAHGEIVSFLDDDVVASADWASQLVTTFAEHHGIIGVAGAAEPLWERPSFGWFPREMFWLIGCTGWMNLHEIVRTTQGATVNVAYNREAFEKAGPMSILLGPQRGARRGSRPIWREGSGEDNEFSRRVVKFTGKPILFNPNVRVHHKVYAYRMTFRWLAQRAWATGWSRRMLKQLYGREDQTLSVMQWYLLRRVAFSLIPMARGLFTRPSIALRQIGLTVMASFFVLLGYFTFPILNPFRHSQSV